MTNIAEGLAGLRVDIAHPEIHPGNYRLGDVETIAASLTRFGQVRPIVVQKSTGRVVAGNHTLKAAHVLGWDEIAVVAVDMPDEEAEAYLVADNRSSDKATNDNALLAPILERLMLAGRLEGTGYTPDNVDDMLASMDLMPEGDPGGFEGGNAVSDEKLAERFANRSQVALRQFVLMYEQDVAEVIEGQFRKLERAWGVGGARDVVREALNRACAEPPVVGLSEAEQARADAPADEGQDRPDTPEEAAEAAAVTAGEAPTAADPTAADAGSNGPRVSAPPVPSETDRTLGQAAAAQVPAPRSAIFDD